ncbi:unnamed protein product [Caenorhabditis brenneri]
MTEDNLHTICTEYFRNYTLTPKEMNHPSTSISSLISVIILVAGIILLSFVMMFLLCIVCYRKICEAREARSSTPGSTKNPEATVSLMTDARIE